MVHVVNAGNYFHYKDELSQAFKLRHQVFVEERGWEALRKQNGLEIDAFDTTDAIHLLAIEGGVTVGYSRLLPTLRPHLLSDVYPQLAERSIPRGADIFEWTRYCVAPYKRGGTIGNIGSRVFCGLLRYALAEGISRLTMETDPLWITRFFDFGFDVEPLGLPQVLDGEPVVAMAVTVSSDAVAQCERMLRIRSIPVEQRGSPLPAVQVPLAA